MPVKNIIWASRHQLWNTQEALLRSQHGKKCDIKHMQIRFENFNHFLEFVKMYYREYYIYAVVPEEWREEVIALGYPLGTVHRPQNVKDQGKRRRVFKIDYHVDSVVVLHKRLVKGYNTKGYRRGKKRIH